MKAADGSKSNCPLTKVSLRSAVVETLVSALVLSVQKSWSSINFKTVRRTSFIESITTAMCDRN